MGLFGHMTICSIMVSKEIEKRRRNMAPKKMIPMMILEILSNYTDEEHTLSQRDIIEILQNEYEVTIERKAVSRNLNMLMEMGHEIGCSESVRMVKVSVPFTVRLPSEVIILTPFFSLDAQPIRSFSFFNSPVR